MQALNCCFLTNCSVLIPGDDVQKVQDQSRSNSESLILSEAGFQDFCCKNRQTTKIECRAY